MRKEEVWGRQGQELDSVLRRRTLQLSRWNMVAASLKVALEKGHGNEVAGGCLSRARLKVFANGLDVGYERENSHLMFRVLT